MSVKNKTNKNYKRSQKGRSMVEMLGVLAIVGVLSVGGLYGYGVAMKKHKANQLLHEASMQAATVSAQIMSGKDPTGLTDFGTGNNITLDTNSIAGNTTFKLKMAGIGKDVCEQMKNSKGGMVREVVCDEATGNATITYYKNLATNEAEGEKSPTDGSGAEVSCNETCDKNATCLPAGYCQCNLGYYGDGTTCISDNGADSLEDCQALSESYGWNGEQCVNCSNSGGTAIGSGGSVETACDCDNIYAATKTDGSCCDMEAGWNGTKCVYCLPGYYSSGGSVETACNCMSSGKNKSDGSCCGSGYGWDGAKCMYCGDDGQGLTGDSPETACQCNMSGKKSDGTCCESEYGWNGTKCVHCQGGLPGSGGSVETACNCMSSGTNKSDGSCCEVGYGWNGTQCVPCNANPIGQGGSVETACQCENKNSDGSCVS